MFNTNDFWSGGGGGVGGASASAGGSATGAAPSAANNDKAIADMLALFASTRTADSHGANPSARSTSPSAASPSAADISTLLLQANGGGSISSADATIGSTPSIGDLGSHHQLMQSHFGNNFAATAFSTPNNSNITTSPSSNTTTSTINNNNSNGSTSGGVGGGANHNNSNTLLLMQENALLKAQLEDARRNADIARKEKDMIVGILVDAKAAEQRRADALQAEKDSLVRTHQAQVLDHQEQMFSMLRKVTELQHECSALQEEVARLRNQQVPVVGLPDAGGIKITLPLLPGAPAVNPNVRNPLQVPAPSSSSAVSSAQQQQANYARAAQAAAIVAPVSAAAASGDSSAEAQPAETLNEEQRALLKQLDLSTAYAELLADGSPTRLIFNPGAPHYSESVRRMRANRALPMPAEPPGVRTVHFRFVPRSMTDIELFTLITETCPDTLVLRMRIFDPVRRGDAEKMAAGAAASNNNHSNNGNNEDDEDECDGDGGAKKQDRYSSVKKSANSFQLAFVEVYTQAQAQAIIHRLSGCLVQSGMHFNLYGGNHSLKRAVEEAENGGGAGAGAAQLAAVEKDSRDHFYLRVTYAKSVMDPAYYQRSDARWDQVPSKDDQHQKLVFTPCTYREYAIARENERLRTLVEAVTGRPCSITLREAMANAGVSDLMRKAVELDRTSGRPSRRVDDADLEPPPQQQQQQQQQQSSSRGSHQQRNSRSNNNSNNGGSGGGGGSQPRNNGSENRRPAPKGGNKSQQQQQQRSGSQPAGNAFVHLAAVNAPQWE